MNRRLTAAVLCGVALAAPAWAHDFWIAPAKFRVARGESVDLPLRNGVEYAGDPVRRDDLRIDRFFVVGPGGTRDVRGADKQDPAGSFTPDADGIWVAAYRSKPRSIELEPAKFEEYLREEGNEHVVKVRAERGETNKVGREIFSRCAKSLLLVCSPAAARVPGADAPPSGDGKPSASADARPTDARPTDASPAAPAPDTAAAAETTPTLPDGHDRVLGLRLEVIPETNPFASATGAELTFRIIYETKALEGALVVARSRAESKHVVQARTGSDGRVKLRLDRAGEWMVKCVHIVPAPAESGMDWESLWASLTFDIAAAK